MSARKLAALLTLLILAVAGAVGVSLLVVRLKPEPPVNGAKLRQQFSDSDAFHNWLHEQLNITVEQEAVILPFENEFQARKVAKVERIRSLNRQLSHAILRDGENSPAIQEILAEIHVAQGQLQQMTIQHIFEMKQYLNPGQYQLLLERTAEVLDPEQKQAAQP